MVRFLYVCLLRLHPRWFRERYADEMLWIFDEESRRRNAGPLLADAAASLVRQWAFRSDFQPEPVAAPAAGRTLDGIPVFYTSEPELPRPSALINGVIASVAVFAAISFAISHGGKPHPFTASIVYYSTPMPDNAALFASLSKGSQPVRGRVMEIRPGDRESAGLWSKFVATVTVALSSKPEEAATTTPPAAKPSEGEQKGMWSTLMSKVVVALGGKPATSSPPAIQLQPQPTVFPPAPAPAAAAGTKTSAADTPFFSLTTGSSPEAEDARPASYIDLLPLLSALDSDSDGVLSAAEIAQSSLVLNALDKNHDGRLSAEESGAQGEAFTRKKRAALLRASRAFMHLHPALAALDADHNGTISAQEIRKAPAALAELDRNYDGKLTEDEVLPDPLSYGVWLILSPLDRNADGRLSRAERANPLAVRWSDLLDAADVNKDRVVTTLELTNALRDRADSNRSGVVTWEELRRSMAPIVARSR